MNCLGRLAANLRPGSEPFVGQFFIDLLKDLPNRLPLSDLQPAATAGSLSIPVFIPRRNSLVLNNARPLGQEKFLVELSPTKILEPLDELGDPLFVGRRELRINFPGQPKGLAMYRANRDQLPLAIRAKDLHVVFDVLAERRDEAGKQNPLTLVARWRARCMATTVLPVPATQ